MKRLVLMVEGDGDAEAVPNLVNRILNDRHNDALFVDSNVIRQAKVPTLIGRKSRPPMEWWKRQLRNAAKRKDLGAVLLLTDGDATKIEHPEYARQFGTNRFCPCYVARWLAEAAKEVGGGEAFSVASVFAIHEYEAWLLADVDPAHMSQLPPQNPEAMRGVKQTLRRVVGSYRERSDQLARTRQMNVERVRQQCRSFRRLERAVDQLLQATRARSHIVSPAPESAA